MRLTRLESMARLGLLVGIVLLPGVARLRAQSWVEWGPNPTLNGQVEGITDREVVGAVNAVAPHPTNPDVVYVGTANGGIWRTDSARAASPTWRNLTPNGKALSIGALEFDPTDPQFKTLVAGLGKTSSFNYGGPQDGLLRSTDGVTWTAIGSDLRGLNISGVVARGPIIIAAVSQAGPGRNPADVGIWRSTDAGSTWKQISGAAGTGLPAGLSFDLASDPNALYTNAGGEGFFRSSDAGATWTEISNSLSDFDDLFPFAENCECATGAGGRVCVAVVQSGQLAGVFFSGNNGGSWVKLGIPTTKEQGGHFLGAHPGRQGGLHLSIAIDRGDTNIVYIGGDRQPHAREGIPQSNVSFPNSIGANDFSGRLFRWNPSTSNWVHLTHKVMANGGGTAGGSAPHADSRDMDVDANGELLEGDDGGIYRRKSPRNNSGDWVSMIGNLGVTEFHAVAWDAVSDIAIGGAQDTGSPQSRLTGRKWESISTADGSTTIIDDFGTAGESLRYTSWQFLGGFRRRRFNAANQFLGEKFPPLIVVDPTGQPVLHPVTGGPFPVPAQFYTPVAINIADSDRLLFGGGDAVYESFDQGDTAIRLTPPIRVTESGHEPLVCGATDNVDGIYAGAGSRVFVRKSLAQGGLVQSTAYAGGPVRAIALDRNKFAVAFVADNDGVFRTDNSGTSWTDIGGALPGLSVGEVHAIAYRADTKQVFLGTDTGVYAATGPAFAWAKLGAGLPNAPVFHLEYDPTDKLLLAATLGRGAWILRF